MTRISAVDSYDLVVDHTLGRWEALRQGGYDEERLVKRKLPLLGPILDDHESPNVEDKEVGIIRGKVSLVGFQEECWCEDAQTTLMENDFQLPPVRFLLAIGAQWPALQTQHTILCLGTFWFYSDGELLWPILTTENGKRIADTFASNTIHPSIKNIGLSDVLDPEKMTTRQHFPTTFRILTISKEDAWERI